jgi:protein TonB
MPLRCLVFSSNEAMVQPIWQVLADLGVEGEYCASAVDAVERVTTQMFQIVITDWDDQPEAAFLLKTAKDLKAAHRPLTLAIVGDDARLPEALKAGANSVLVKPIRPEQVRDTMSTACELLRAKQPAAPRAGSQEAGSGGAAAIGNAQPPAAEFSTSNSSVPSFPVPKFSPPAFSVSSSSGAAAVAAAKVAPASVTQAPENTFRAGEFLQPGNSAPGAQFATEERETEGDKSEEQAGADEVEALTELEPMAAAVEKSAAQEAPPETQPEASQPLTGWAALQARLVKTVPAPAKEVPAKSELLSYDNTPSLGEAERLPQADKKPEKPQPESKTEAELFAYMDGETAESSAATPHSKHGRIILLGVLAVACVAVAVVPQARRGAQTAARAGAKWLNPPPAAVPQAAPQHDSFGQAGDEYKLPTVGNIPDATTDPSQIRVVPVVDPTAKPNKNADANNGQTQTPGGDGGVADPSSPATNPNEATATDSNSAAATPVGQSQSEENPEKNTPAPAVVERSPNPVVAAVTLPAVQPDKIETQSAPPPRPAPPPAQRPAPSHPATVANNVANHTGIPSSLRTQMASSTPEASGNKPPEAAMSSIEPVPLKESAVRDLLLQPVDPEYPASAKASGQRGSVVLQVIVGRDGAVQDAKFLQGSLVFARAAIDAVKQWRFKPYSMNGRAVSVQGVITLNFKPPA